MSTASPIDQPHWLERIAQLSQATRAFAVAIVLEADDSTPVKAGAVAIIEADGRIHGTVGGGAVEAEAQAKAIACIRSGEATVFEFSLHGPGVHHATPICGGRMRLLVDPSPARAAEEYARALAAISTRKPGILVLNIRHARTAARFIAKANFDAEARQVGAANLRACLAAEEPALFKVAADHEIFLSPVLPRPVLLIVGGGHVGQAVAVQANLVGFEIVVIDDRPEFTQASLFPAAAKTICSDPARALVELSLDRGTFVVIVTRGHQQDAAALRSCIGHNLAYIGMIGSRRKVPLLRRQFVESGWATPSQFDTVYAPIGLDIGARTVPEIATSIVAQLIQVRRTGSSLRFTPS